MPRSKGGGPPWHWGSLAPKAPVVLYAVADDARVPMDTSLGYVVVATEVGAISALELSVYRLTHDGCRIVEGNLLSPSPDHPARVFRQTLT
jgi:hypothetical protein